jgi:hypothetical protein
VVAPGDAQVLAATLRPLLLDAPLARAMGRAGRSHVMARYGTDQARRTLRHALALD